MSEPTVIYEIRDHVAYITLNRPAKKNAIDAAMRREVQDAFADVRFNPEVWAAILTANGDTFCSGKDLFDKLDADGNIMGGDELYDYIRHIYKPLVVALNGPCLAQGAGFAMIADIVIMSERASIGWPQVKRGISSNSGPTYFATAVPWNIAMGYLLRGRPVTPADALRLGVANEVVPHEKLMEVAEQYVREICENAPLAVQGIKESARRGENMPVTARMHIAKYVNKRVAATEDAKEGIRAFKEKRKPVWKGM